MVSDHAVCCDFSSADKWYVGKGSRREDDREEHDLEPLPSFTEVHVSFEMVKSFFVCVQH